MSTSDLFNLTLLESVEEVDQINKKFYGRYNYPWAPFIVQAYPADVATLFVNQDIGSWTHDRIPLRPKIWVAGCGTNQALLTALKFPQAEVLGTDISTQSLEACRKKARQIGVENLQLEEKSLNEVTHEEAFDYIICTGVVHHNARPEATLKKISRALKKNGILEFMVYNYYHRILTVSCQKAIRSFYDHSMTMDLDLELKLAKRLIADIQQKGLMGDFIRSHARMHEAEMTDSIIQPLEYNYTVESLVKLTGDCDLEILYHCQNQFDVASNAFTWNMRFQDDYLKNYYNSLPDAKRWQISNLLMFNESPMLWFYFQRKGSDLPRMTEQELCASFMETSFRKNSVQLNNYVLDEGGNYKLAEKTMKYPSDNAIDDPVANKIFNAVAPRRKMKDIFHELRIAPDFYEINRARIKLTTSGYPYLLANQ